MTGRRWRPGSLLDEVVLRSYAIGAAHQALGWVRSEAWPSTTTGAVLDLTIRSFGILAARAMPSVEVVVEDDPRPAAWRWEIPCSLPSPPRRGWRPGFRPSWPVDPRRSPMSTPVGPVLPGGAGRAVARVLGPDRRRAGRRTVPSSSAGGVVEAQARQALGQRAALARWGRQLGWANVVKTTVFLTDMADYAAFNAIYVERALGDHRPARSVVAVAGLPLGALVEIEAWAYEPLRRRRRAEPADRSVVGHGVQVPWPKR